MPKGLKWFVAGACVQLELTCWLEHFFIVFF
jgi:hypothetical protein